MRACLRSSLRAGFYTVRAHQIGGLSQIIHGETDNKLHSYFAKDSRAFLNVLTHLSHIA